MIYCGIYLIIICSVVLSIAVLFLKGRKAYENRLFLGCQFSVVLWCASQIMNMVCDHPSSLWFSYLFGNIGICFIGTFWLLFACYYGKEGQLRYGRLLKGITYGISVFHIGVILSNQYHHLYYETFSIKEVVHGPLFYVNVIYTYCCVLVGSYILLRYMKRYEMGERRYARILIVASVLLPTLLNGSYLIGLLPTQYDFTPMSFGISSILVLCATIRYRFLEVNVTAFDAVLHGLSDGVAIYDGKRLSYSNPAFLELMKQRRGAEDNGGQELFCAFQILEQRSDGCLLYDEMTDRYYELQQYQQRVGAMQEFVRVMPLMGEEGRRVYVLSDVSRYYELLEKTKALSISKEQLALAKERNRIAQQVHDTTGHTLVMIQSLLKLAMFAEEEQRNDRGEAQTTITSSVEENEKEAGVLSYLEEAKVLVQNGIRELREAINDLKQEESYELVTKGIMQLAKQVKEIPVQVTIQGTDSERYSHLSNLLYTTLRESITNCLKYAKATQMDVVLRFKEEQIELLIADDGVGCDVIVENNGLKGIRERILNAGGSVRFSSEPQEGFLTRVQVPVS